MIMNYITTSNAKKIIYDSDLKNIDLNGQIYKIPIYFYSKYEKNSLLAIRELLKNPESYFDNIYKPYVSTDTYRYVYEGNSPRYHNDLGCELLNSDFKNYIIPEPIAGDPDKVVEFREWFETNKHLIQDNPDLFVINLQHRWDILTNVRSIERLNSGVDEVDDLTIEELEDKIDALIKDAGRFYYKSTMTKKVLSKYSRRTFLLNKQDSDLSIEEFSDDKVRKLLTDYIIKFKKPLQHYLIEYYKLKHNPGIEMQGYYLDQLGFKPCRRCFKN